MHYRCRKISTNRVAPFLSGTRAKKTTYAQRSSSKKTRKAQCLTVPTSESLLTGDQTSLPYYALLQPTSISSRKPSADLFSLIDSVSWLRSVFPHSNFKNPSSQYKPVQMKYALEQPLQILAKKTVRLSNSVDFFSGNSVQNWKKNLYTWKRWLRKFRYAVTSCDSYVWPMRKARRTEAGQCSLARPTVLSRFSLGFSFSGSKKNYRE